MRERGIAQVIDPGTIARVDLLRAHTPAYVESMEPDLAHLSVDEFEGLRAVAVEAQTLLDSVDRACLVHSDLNPKNLLLDPESLELTALLEESLR